MSSCSLRFGSGPYSQSMTYAQFVLYWTATGASDGKSACETTILVRKKYNWTRAPSQYPKRRLFVRSREVSKPRDWYFKLTHRFEIWQAHRQQCWRSACQISERSGNSKYKSRGFETLRDLRKDVFSDIETGPRKPHQLLPCSGIATIAYVEIYMVSVHITWFPWTCHWNINP